MISCLLLCHLFGSGIDTQMKQFFEQYNSAPQENSLETLLDGKGISQPPILTPESAESSASTTRHSLDYITGSLNTTNSKRIVDSLLSIGLGEPETQSKERMNAYAYLASQNSFSATILAGLQIQSWANQFNTMALLSDIAAVQGEGMLVKSQRADALADELELAKEEKIDRVEARSRLLEKEHSAPSQNIAWDALGDLNEEAKHLLITIAGTIVVHPNRIECYPPLYKEAIKTLLDGTAGKGYRSSNEGTKEAPLPDRTGEKAKITGLLKGIQQKLLEERAPFTEDEQKLLQTSRFPLGSLIILMTQYKGPGSAVALERFGHLIALDRVLQFVEEALSDVLNKARAYAIVHTIGEAYVQQVEQAIGDLQDLKADHRDQIKTEMSAIDLMLQIDQSLKASEKGV